MDRLLHLAALLAAASHATAAFCDDYAASQCTDAFT
eukprot:COSAG06_NODE_27333_length_595_cov_1.131048_1_plen_35_part_10